MGLFLFTDGGSFVQEKDNGWAANLDTPEGRNWINNCRRIFKTIPGDTLATMDSFTMAEAFNQGRAGATIAGAWFWDMVDETTGQKLMAAPFPRGKGSRVSLLSGWNIAIFANSSHKDAAFKVLEWKSDPVVATKTTAGLSGRKDAIQYATNKTYIEFQELMQYGVGMTPPTCSLRSEITTALLPVFQEAVFSDKLSLENAAAACNKAIQRAIDENL
jgi:ABC-type glycerol-3-phosphate transport system substrate-binding protein